MNTVLADARVKPGENGSFLVTVDDDHRYTVVLSQAFGWSGYHAGTGRLVVLRTGAYARGFASAEDAVTALLGVKR